MKKLLVILFILVLVFSITSSVSAQNSASQLESGDVPEKNGDYSDPKNKKLRVRVFVHEPRGAKKVPPVVSNLCSDQDSLATVSATPWHLPSNVTYRLNVSSISSFIGSNNIASISANAFNVWQEAVLGKVNFARGNNTFTARSANDGQNIIAWGRTNSSTLGVTYIRYYIATGLVVDVDTIMNKRVSWSWTDPASSACSIYPNTYDTQNILTHEIGHWLGLNDHYNASYADATMYGYGSKGETKKNTLTTGDKANLNIIYP